MTDTDPIRKNRCDWNTSSDDYQKRHGGRLTETAMAWGIWRIPESEVQGLGDVAGRDVLELGCGAAQWSIALAEQGARAVGIDLSERQLIHAGRDVRGARVEVALVHGNAEALPFRTSSFDIVFCDHGAVCFASPSRIVPEASRVLRPGGLFAFCMSTPIRDICWDEEIERVSDRLVDNYFELDRFEDDETVFYQLGYGDWIRLFRSNGFEVEDLIELRAPEAGTTTFSDYVSRDWARKWPAEHIWKVRRRPIQDAYGVNS
jgi:SAM-dependent methyltransferase